MKITIQSSRLVKPDYSGSTPPPSTDQHLPLNVFDMVTENFHVALIYAFHPPTPPNIAIEKGLSKVLSEYRVLAGRLDKDGDTNRGKLVFLLNDQGVRFVEATVENTELKNVLPLHPNKKIDRCLHPNVHGVKEIMQVQLTRFPCGSLVVGFTCHHQVADGQAASNFFVAWGRATRGLAVDPIPLHARDTLFTPRDPPLVQYNHGEIEYTNDKEKYLKTMFASTNSNVKDNVVCKVCFTNEFVNKLRSKVSTEVTKPYYSRFTIVCAHLWRAITKARGLQGHVTTEICIAVDGRNRMDPKVPNEFFGNLVLSAFPRSNVKDLTDRPISYAAELIRSEVEKVNDSYFKSFIDFASSDVINKEGYVSLNSIKKRYLCPNLDVASWLRHPFFDLDFGTGKPYYFAPSYIGTEGTVLILPFRPDDESVEAVVTLFRDNIDTFERCCYSIQSNYITSLY